MQFNGYAHLGNYIILTDITVSSLWVGAKAREGGMNNKIIMIIRRVHGITYDRDALSPINCCIFVEADSV